MKRMLKILLLLLPFTVLAKTPSNANWYDNLIFKTPSFSFEFARDIGYTYSGGADIGECIATAKKIQDGDIFSWYREWSNTANRLDQLANQMQKAGHVVSAREIYFRESNYYRTAEFYLHAKPYRAQALKTWQKSHESFNKAIASLPNIKPIRIPYEKTYLPGYLMTTTKKQKNVPLLIVHSGFDGTAEELYFEVGLAAIQRGYDCLIFEGPGQGAVIREQGLPYRYDWEKVVTPVVDYAMTLPNIDKNKIALMGISMGGYFAARAAAFEPRISACIVNGGVYDLSENIYKTMPSKVTSLIDKNPQKFNQIMQKNMKANINTRWFFENGMWTFDAKSPADLMKKIKKYTLKDVIQNIKCSMLVIDSTDDMFYKGQTEQVYKALKSPNTLLIFNEQETAQAHCQMGAIAISNEKIFNWLDKTFKN